MKINKKYLYDFNNLKLPITTRIANLKTHIMREKLNQQ